MTVGVEKGGEGSSYPTLYTGCGGNEGGTAGTSLPKTRKSPRDISRPALRHNCSSTQRSPKAEIILRSKDSVDTNRARDPELSAKTDGEALRTDQDMKRLQAARNALDIPRN